MLPRVLRLASYALFASATACTSAKPAAKPALTERQRDSVIGASKLPGAQGVARALSAQDSAAAKLKRLDSIARADSR